MKQLIFCAVFGFGVIGFAQAQTTGTQRSKTTPLSSKNNRSVLQNKSSSSSSISRDSTSNNRVMYKSKRTGQSATQSGQEATGTNGTQANMSKNAARKDE